jgi:FemAB-related protein (PEP-CTERM system-associated)
MSFCQTTVGQLHPGSDCNDAPFVRSGTPVIEPLSVLTQARWDDYVASHPDGTFFHRAAWRSLIERAFGHRTHYVFARRGDLITGVLPLVHLNSRVFGSSLISNAFCVRGGPLATDEESLDLLRQYAVSAMDRLDVDRLEFRLDSPSGSPGWLSRSDVYATFRRPIVADDEQNLKAIPRKQRAVIRKALQSQLSVSHDPDVRRFFRIYSESVRNLGTPVFARKYFELLVEEFADCCEILTVIDDGKPVAAVLSFFFKDEVLPYYGGGTPLARLNGANDFMYWELMRHAARRGCRIYDFGRSKIGTGAYAFKKNWGFPAKPLTYEFRVKEGKQLSDRTPLNPKYAPYIAAWKRLPLPVANLLGPPIVRFLG